MQQSQLLESFFRIIMKKYMFNIFSINIKSNCDQVAWLAHTAIKRDIYYLKRKGDGKLGVLLSNWRILASFRIKFWLIRASLIHWRMLCNCIHLEDKYLANSYPNIFITDLWPVVIVPALSFNFNSLLPPWHEASDACSSSKQGLLGLFYPGYKIYHLLACPCKIWFFFFLLIILVIHTHTDFQTRLLEANDYN